jgi:hypothetical protein
MKALKLSWRLRSIPASFLLVCGFPAASLTAHAEIRVIARPVLAITPLGRNQVRYTYRVQAENLGAAATRVTAVAQSFTPLATIAPGTLTFPDMPAGATALSTNSFSVIYNIGGPPGITPRGNSGGSVTAGQTVLPPASLIRFVFSAISTPVADAGPDRLITALNGGTAGVYCCRVNGGGSFDPFGLPLGYQWSVVSAPSGSKGGFTSGSDQVAAVFVPDVAGDYTVQLVVSNGYHASAPSYLHLSTVAVAPRAYAGLNRTIKAGDTVQLDGTRSVNPMNRPLTYAWSFVLWPGATQPAISDPANPRPTFVAGVAGTYKLRLEVTDGALTSAPATVSYTTGNTPPHADAGPDLHIAEGSYGFLSANRTTDSDGDFLTYRWAILSGGQGYRALDPVPNPDFLLNYYQLLHVQLFVSDGYAESISTQVINGGNLAPELQLITNTVLPAIATVDPPGTTAGAVTLDGTETQSSDLMDEAYWTLREAPAESNAQLSANGLTATIKPDLAGLYVVQFYTDTWGYTNYPTAVSFLTQGGPPVANPGSTQWGVWTAPALHTLNGSGSWDPGGLPLTYRWSLLSAPNGSNALLSSTTAVSPTFTADMDGTYIFQLVVNNGTADSTPATVSIISKDKAAPAAVDVSIKSPWKTPCVPVTMHGNDPKLDPYSYGYQILTLPSYGYLAAFVPSQRIRSNPILSTGPSQGLGHAASRETSRGASNATSNATVESAIPSPFPPASYDGGVSPGDPADNPFGLIGAKTECYIPFSSTWVGIDTFTYGVWDEGYPSGCFVASNYCIGAKRSEPASASIQVFQN